MAGCQVVVIRSADPFIQVVYSWAEVRWDWEGDGVFVVDSDPQGWSNWDRLQVKYLSVVWDKSVDKVQQGVELYVGEDKGEFLVECEGEAVQVAADTIQSHLLRRVVLYDPLIDSLIVCLFVIATNNDWPIYLFMFLCWLVNIDYSSEGMQYQSNTISE